MIRKEITVIRTILGYIEVIAKDCPLNKKYCTLDYHSGYFYNSVSCDHYKGYDLNDKNKCYEVNCIGLNSLDFINE